MQVHTSFFYKPPFLCFARSPDLRGTSWLQRYNKNLIYANKNEKSSGGVAPKSGQQGESGQGESGQGESGRYYRPEIRRKKPAWNAGSMDETPPNSKKRSSPKVYSKME